jgi:hypothetical protein
MSMLGGVRGGDREESPYSITVTAGLTAALWQAVAEEDGSRTHLRPSDGPTRI